MTELDEIVPGKEPGRTGIAVVGLALAALAAVCIPLGCLSWLVTWYAIAPLALFGLVCSLFGRGRLRVAAVALNGALLLFGTGFWAVVAGAR